MRKPRRDAGKPRGPKANGARAAEPGRPAAPDATPPAVATPEPPPAPPRCVWCTVGSHGTCVGGCGCTDPSHAKATPKARRRCLGCGLSPDGAPWCAVRISVSGAVAIAVKVDACGPDCIGAAVYRAGGALDPKALAALGAP